MSMFLLAYNFMSLLLLKFFEVLGLKIALVPEESLCLALLQGDIFVAYVLIVLV